MTSACMTSSLFLTMLATDDDSRDYESKALSIDHMTNIRKNTPYNDIFGGNLCYNSFLNFTRWHYYSEYVFSYIS
jgi:hypothetical protein